MYTTLSIHQDLDTKPVLWNSSLQCRRATVPPKPPQPA